VKFHPHPSPLPSRERGNRNKTALSSRERGFFLKIARLRLAMI